MLIDTEGEVDKNQTERNHGQMPDSTALQVPLAPIGYTSLAIVISLVCRALFIPQWNPIEKPADELLFLVFWVMSVLPMLYLSFRRWVENSISSFIPQVFLFIVLSLGIQIALNAVSLSLGLLEMSSAALRLLVWTLPWLALSTVFKNSYSTASQCKKLLLVLVPTILIFDLMYFIVSQPLLTPAIGSRINASAAILLSMFVSLYGVVFWRLRKASTCV